MGDPSQSTPFLRFADNRANGQQARALLKKKKEKEEEEEEGFEAIVWRRRWRFEVQPPRVVSGAQPSSRTIGRNTSRCQVTQLLNPLWQYA